MCNRRHRHNTHTSAHSEDVALRFKLPFFHIHSVTLVSYRSIPNSISSICEWFFVVVLLRSIVRSLYILVWIGLVRSSHKSFVFMPSSLLCVFSMCDRSFQIYIEYWEVCASAINIKSPVYHFWKLELFFFIRCC